MYNFPDFKPRAVLEAKHKCFDCDKWSTLTNEQTVQLDIDWNNVYRGQGVPARACKCEHCGAEIDISTIGKYDLPGDDIKNCQVLWVKLKEAPRRTKPYADQIDEQFKIVQELLAPKFTLMTPKPLHNSIMLNTKDEAVKIVVTYKPGKVLGVGIAFQHPFGGWHQLSNFPYSEYWDRVRAQFKVEDVKASLTTRGPIGDVLQLAKQLAA